MIVKSLFGDIHSQFGSEGVEQCRVLLGAAILERARESGSKIIDVIILDDATGKEEETIHFPVP